MNSQIKLKELIEGITSKDSLETLANGRLITIIPGEDTDAVNALTRELDRKGLNYFVADGSGEQFNPIRVYKIDLRQIELIY